MSLFMRFCPILFWFIRDGEVTVRTCAGALSGLIFYIFRTGNADDVRLWTHLIAHKFIRLFHGRVSRREVHSEFK